MRTRVDSEAVTHQYTREMKLCQATDVAEVHDSVIVPGLSCLDEKKW